MRLQFIIWPLIIFGLVAVLFQVKQAARADERALARLNANIEATEQSIEVLRAEWSHLNQPAYLKSLAMRHLDYTGDTTTVVGKISDLPDRKPRPEAPAAVERSSAQGSLPAPQPPTPSRPQTLPQPPTPEAVGSFRHVTDIDLIGSMIRSELGE